MLRNPAYRGAGRVRQDEDARAATASRRAPPAPAVSATAAAPRASDQPAEKWMLIPVPPIVTEETFALAQARLAQNAHFAKRNTKQPDAAAGHPRLPRVRLRLLPHHHPHDQQADLLLPLHRLRTTGGTSAGACATAARSAPTSSTRSSGARSAGCSRTPTLVRAEIDRRLPRLRTEHPAARRREALERDLTRAEAAITRLIEAYQEQLISLDELRARMPALRKRQTTLRAQLDALETELHDAETYLKLADTLEGFLDPPRRRARPAETSTSNSASCGSSSAKCSSAATTTRSRSATRSPPPTAAPRPPITNCVGAVISPLLIQHRAGRVRSRA